MTTTPQTLTTSDGAQISFTTQGSGPHLLLVPSVASSRTTDPQPDLAAALAERFTVTSYERRGTGESSMPPGSSADDYDVAQEIDDIRLLAEHLGAPVEVYGFSSGAVLAALAARAGAPISRLYLLEPPLFVPGALDGARDRMRELLDQDRAAARHYFLTDVTGIPAEIVDQIPTTEQHLADVPATLHELSFLPGLTADDFTSVSVPTLVMASSQTAPQLQESARDLARAIPGAQLSELPGEWHGVPAKTQLDAILQSRAQSS